MSLAELSEQEIIRRNSLNELKNLGINAYPAPEFKVTHLSKEILNKFEKSPEELQEVVIAGRMMSRRIMGKASFFELQDAEGRIQVYVSRDDVSRDEACTMYNTVFKKLMDIGDIVGVKGFVFRTNMGEISVHAKELVMLSKSLRPLPVVKEKDGKVFDAFTDPELRYRQRYLDLIVNPQVKDVFIFREGNPEHLPTNWESKFGGPAWEYVPSLKKWYLHLFDVTQADLNWDNPEVREELKQVVRFWKEKGVKGFRFDVVNLISKPEKFENDMDGDGRRFYTDGPHVHEYLKELVKDTGIEEMVTVGEMSSTTLENCIRYSNPAERELSMCFHFHHLKDEKKYWKESAKMLAVMIHLMRGTPYIYQGEELGMTNAHYTSIDQYRDVESLNYYEILRNQGKTETEALDIIAKRSRDNGRTPMQWNGTENAGFSTQAPWLAVTDNYREINVETEEKDPDSILNFYKKLVQLRKEKKIISEGKISFIQTTDDTLFVYKRSLGEQELVVLNHLSDEVKPVIVPETWQNYHRLLGNYDKMPEYIPEEKKFCLRPYETIVLEK